jgi:hypothetical protein
MAQFFSLQQTSHFLHARIAQTVFFTRKTKSYCQKMTPPEKGIDTIA